MAEGDKSGRGRQEWPRETRVAEGDKSGRVRPEWPSEARVAEGHIMFSRCLFIHS